MTQCDSPYSLANATFDWIKDNLKDEIDFVVWTGDSARHDNDERIPRSMKQVEDLNKFLVHKFVEVFGKTDNINDPDPTNDFLIPIIPTIGNNDVLPHNIFKPGPNRWTKTFASIWRKFIPEEQRHSFTRGGWFYTEVIPNKLAVFSLNTLYFFESNGAVDGCNVKSEPGYEHMEWLRIQLQFLRQRGMKAIISGHVPPARTGSKQNWDESCWQKYTLWLRQYRDVIVGGLYGHMNIDHFVFQDMNDLKFDFKVQDEEDREWLAIFESEATREDLHEQQEFTITAKSTYLNELRAAWSELPTPPHGLRYNRLDDDDEEDLMKKSKKKRQKDRFLKTIGGKWAERFSMSLISPSVVPNFYPTLRVFEYNVTGLEKHHPATSPIGDLGDDDVAHFEQEADVQRAVLKTTLLDVNEEPTEASDSGEVDPNAIARRKHRKKKTPKFKVPKSPSKSSPPGPAYSPQTFTFLGYTQYLANLTTINAAHAKMMKDEHTLIDSELDKLRKKKVDFQYEIEYATRNDSVYKLHDLTVRSWLDLAQTMGKRSQTKADITPPLIPADPPSAVGTLDDGFLTVDHELALANGDLQANGDEEATSIESTKHKKKKKKKRRKLRNKTWKMFVKRAFVMTKPDHELDEEFGEPVSLEL